MTYEDLASILAQAFTVAAQPVDGDHRQWVFDFTDPREIEWRAACRKAAEDMAAAGLGWHEDMLERLTRPQILFIKQVADNFVRGSAKDIVVGLLSSRFPHRRCGIKSRYKGKVRYDAAH